MNSIIKNAIVLQIVLLCFAMAQNVNRINYVNQKIPYNSEKYDLFKLMDVPQKSDLRVLQNEKYNKNLLTTQTTNQQFSSTTGYAMTDLGVPGIYFWGVNNNNAGQIICSALEAVTYRNKAMIWDVNNGWEELPVPNEAVSSSATQINDNGIIVGQYVIDLDGRWQGRACYWDEDGFHKLMLFPDWKISTASAINSSGTIVGAVMIANTNKNTPIIWEQGEVSNLGIPDDRYSAYSSDINNSGQIIIEVFNEWWGDNSCYFYNGFEWSNIGSFGGVTVPWSINDFVQIVGNGWTTPAYYPHYAFLWEEKSGMTNLGTLGGDVSRAFDINNCRQIVGTSELSVNPPYPRNAYHWNKDNGMQSLGTLPGATRDRSEANTINDNGQIVGSSYASDGMNHVVIWQLEDPVQAVRYIISLIPALDINNGQMNSLLSKLESAIKSENNGQYKAAINILKAFINQVNEFINGGILTLEKGQDLIDAANEAINMLDENLAKQWSIFNEVDEGGADLFELEDSYPNPFNPSTTIRYKLATDSRVLVEIYDISGRLMSTLIKTNQSQGWHSVMWNGTNQQGEQVPAGLYISKITSGNEVKTTKLMLLK